MAKKRPQVALVYDFDGTLSPGNMQEFGFIQATGKTKDEFWEKNRKLAEGKDANGILTQVAPATRDADSGLYCSERIEVPCRRGDALWLTIAYQDTQNIECEVTLGRWEITDNGDVQRKPELAQDIYPTLTWPEENNKTAQL